MENNLSHHANHQVRRRATWALAMGVIVAVVVIWGYRLWKPLQYGSPCANRIVAYYFHRAARGPTCRQVELCVRETIAQAFPAQLEQGRLQWQTVDYQASENQHFRVDYNLTAPCLVLVRLQGGRPVEWRSVPEVWESADDRAVLEQVVRRNVQEFLDYIDIPRACCT